jgi:hypothetical protein
MATSLPPEDIKPGCEDDDYTTDRYGFADRIKYWAGGAIDDSTMNAVQHACILEAGKKMCGSLKKSTSEQEELILEFFCEATKSLLDAKLLSQQQHDSISTKINNASKNQPLKKQVHKKFFRIKKEIANEIVLEVIINTGERCVYREYYYVLLRQRSKIFFPLADKVWPLKFEFRL